MPERLNPHLHRIYALYAEGFTVACIAPEFHLSERQIEERMQRIEQLLGKKRDQWDPLPKPEPPKQYIGIKHDPQQHGYAIGLYDKQGGFTQVPYTLLMTDKGVAQREADLLTRDVSTHVADIASAPFLQVMQAIQRVMTGSTNRDNAYGY